MSSSLRRLASDQASLRQFDLPPNYLFVPGQDNRILPDDLTQLSILLTGAQGTPYAHGVWQLHLRMPTDYPKNPPRATFKTRMWHPNVEESTGAVCLETLKRDWDPKLTLRDILLTISCLLIHPNPDSALNSAAGSLLQDDYEAFAEQARLMTSIHARIPASLRRAVDEARSRGEECDSGKMTEEQRPGSASRVESPSHHTSLRRTLPTHRSRPSPLPLTPGPAVLEVTVLSDDEEDHDPAKENDPSQSPSLVVQTSRSPRKNVLGKRPLSELPTPTDPEDAMTASEQNIAVNQVGQPASAIVSSRAKKSPKLVAFAGGVNASGRVRENADDGQQAMGCCTKTITPGAGDEKENENINTSEAVKVPVRIGQNSAAPSTRPTFRKVSNVVSSKGKSLARVGIRRL